MKTRYRIIARRKIEASKRLRLRSDRPESLRNSLDDPTEMPSEVVELATEGLKPGAGPKGND